MERYLPNKRVDLWVVWYSSDGEWILDGVYEDEDLRDRRISKHEAQNRIVESRRLMTCTPERPRMYQAYRGATGRELEMTHHW